MSDEKLFLGAVPQPAEWLRVYRLAGTGQVSRAASDLTLTEEFISSCRSDTGPVESRAISSMLRILAEVIREGKRDRLRSARSITFSLDDKTLWFFAVTLDPYLFWVYWVSY